MGAKLSKKKKSYCLGAGKEGESTETTEVEQKEPEIQDGQKDAVEPNGEKPQTDQSESNGISEEQKPQAEKQVDEVTSGETTKDDTNTDQKQEANDAPKHEQENNGDTKEVLQDKPEMSVVSSSTLQEKACDGEKQEESVSGDKAQLVEEPEKIIEKSEKSLPSDPAAPSFCNDASSHDKELEERKGEVKQEAPRENNPTQESTAKETAQEAPLALNKVTEQEIKLENQPVVKNTDKALEWEDPGSVHSPEVVAVKEAEKLEMTTKPVDTSDAIESGQATEQVAQHLQTPETKSLEPVQTEELAKAPEPMTEPMNAPEQIEQPSMQDPVPLEDLAVPETMVEPPVMQEEKLLNEQLPPKSIQVPEQSANAEEHASGEMGIDALKSQTTGVETVLPEQPSKTVEDCLAEQETHKDMSTLQPAPPNLQEDATQLSNSAEQNTPDTDLEEQRNKQLIHQDSDKKAAEQEGQGLETSKEEKEASSNPEAVNTELPTEVHDAADQTNSVNEKPNHEPAAEELGNDHVSPAATPQVNDKPVINGHIEEVKVKENALENGHEININGQEIQVCNE